MVLRPPDTCLLLIVRSQIKCSVHQGAPSCPTLCNTTDCKPARLLCPWGLSRPEHQRGLPFPSPGDLPNPGIETRSPPLQEYSLPSEPPGEPQVTGNSAQSQPNLSPTPYHFLSIHYFCFFHDPFDARSLLFIDFDYFWASLTRFVYYYIKVIRTMSAAQKALRYIY